MYIQYLNSRVKGPALGEVTQLVEARIFGVVKRLVVRGSSPLFPATAVIA